MKLDKEIYLIQVGLRNFLNNFIGIYWNSFMSMSCSI